MQSVGAPEIQMNRPFLCTAMARHNVVWPKTMRVRHKDEMTHLESRCPTCASRHSLGSLNLLCTLPPGKPFGRSTSESAPDSQPSTYWVYGNLTPYELEQRDRT